MRFPNPTSRPMHQKPPNVKRDPQVQAAIKQAKDLKSSKPLYVVRTGNGVGLSVTPTQPATGSEFLIVKPSGRVVYETFDPLTGRKHNKVLYKGRGEETSSEGSNFW